MLLQWLVRCGRIRTPYECTCFLHIPKCQTIFNIRFYDTLTWWEWEKTKDAKWKLRSEKDFVILTANSQMKIYMGNILEFLVLPQDRLWVILHLLVVKCELGILAGSKRLMRRVVMEARKHIAYWNIHFCVEFNSFYEARLPHFWVQFQKMKKLQTKITLENFVLS